MLSQYVHMTSYELLVVVSGSMTFEWGFGAVAHQGIGLHSLVPKLQCQSRAASPQNPTWASSRQLVASAGAPAEQVTVAGVNVYKRMASS